MVGSITESKLVNFGAKNSLLGLGDSEATHRYMLFHLFILAVISFI